MLSVRYKELEIVTTLVAEDGLVRMAERHISLPKPFLTGDPVDWF